MIAVDTQYLDAREVFAAFSIDAHSVARADEKGDLHDGTGFERGGLAAARCSVALE
jgi:hypothetical protein